MVKVMNGKLKPEVGAVTIHGTVLVETKNPAKTPNHDFHLS